MEPSARTVLPALLVLAFFGVVLFWAEHERVLSPQLRSRDDADPSFNWNWNDDTAAEFALRHFAEVTIVTAWYPDTVPEHSTDSSNSNDDGQFPGWLSALLATRARIYVFTTPSRLAQLRAARLSACPIAPAHWNADFSSPDQLPMFHDPHGLVVTADDWAQQRHCAHAPRLAALRLAKSWLLKKASDDNPFHTRFFLWLDADTLHADALRRCRASWPDALQLRRGTALLSAASDWSPRVWISLLGPLPPPPSKQPLSLAAAADQLRFGPLLGSALLADASAVNWLYNEVRRAIYKFPAQPWCDDQHVYLYLAWTQPSSFLFLQTYRADRQCGDPHHFHRLFLDPGQLPPQCHERNSDVYTMNILGEQALTT